MATTTTMITSDAPSVGIGSLIAAASMSAIGGYFFLNMVINYQRRRKRKLKQGERQSIASSSQLVVAWRAIENKRMDALFQDDLAEKLAGPRAMHRAEERLKLLAQGGSEGSTSGAGARIVVRCKYFDEWTVHAMREDSQIKQVVILGAGMDTRAYRLPALHDTVIFELDMPEVISMKEKLLMETDQYTLPPMPRCRAVVRVPCNLISKSWARQLMLAGFNPALRSLWIIEGLLYYLPETCVDRLFENIADLSAPGSRMIASMVLELSARQQAMIDSQKVREAAVQGKSAANGPSADPFKDPVPESVEKFAMWFETCYYWFLDLFSSNEYYPSSFSAYPPVADYIVDTYYSLWQMVRARLNHVRRLVAELKMDDGGNVSGTSLVAPGGLGQHFQWACPNPMAYVNSFGLETEKVIRLGDAVANYGRIVIPENGKSNSKTVYVSFFRPPLITQPPDRANTPTTQTKLDYEESQISDTPILQEVSGLGIDPNATLGSIATVQERRNMVPRNPANGAATAGDRRHIDHDFADENASESGFSMKSSTLDTADVSTVMQQLATLEIMIKNLAIEKEKHEAAATGMPAAAVSAGPNPQGNTVERDVTTNSKGDILVQDRSLTSSSGNVISPGKSGDQQAEILQLLKSLKATPAIHPGHERSAAVSSKPSSSTSTSGLKIQLKLQRESLLDHGAEIRVVGSLPQLGEWNANNAPRLFPHSRRNDILTEEIEFGNDKDYIYLEYKYVLVLNGTLVWEKGPNRFCEVVADEMLILNDVTRF